jgi:hypothetical protein
MASSETSHVYVRDASGTEGFDTKSLHNYIFCCLFWRAITASRVRDGYTFGDWRALAGTGDV